MHPFVLVAAHAAAMLPVLVGTMPAMLPVVLVGTMPLVLVTSSRHVKYFLYVQLRLHE